MRPSGSKHHSESRVSKFSSRRVAKIPMAVHVTQTESFNIEDC